MTPEQIELIDGNIRKHIGAANEAFEAAELDKDKNTYWNDIAISNLATAAEFSCMTGIPHEITQKALVATAVILSRNNHPKAPQFIERLLNAAPNHPGALYCYALNQVKAGNVLLAYQKIILAETFKNQYDYMGAVNPGSIPSSQCSITEIEDLKLAIEYVLSGYAELSRQEMLAKINEYYENFSPLRTENRETPVKIEPTPEPTEPETEPETDETEETPQPSASILNIDAEYYEEEDEVDEEPTEPEADLPETYPV